ncbi:family 20 glycosylhydrolase [Arenibacter algicola]|uniref:beta-N-acetylhexosaminidase n=1 Tax=Arenibacter algicola TaxID=616991 RepID=UPI001C06CD62|nr:family 20 glycosylhydrolase [Arenibacter algicola]MBU2904099.1 family 20 glycosylhydrolase [Arenibacter algicola]
MLISKKIYTKKKLRSFLEFFSIIILLCGVSCVEINQKNEIEPEISKVNIIPKPVLLKNEPGSFRLTSDVNISGNPEVDDIVIMLSEQLSAVGLKLDVNKSSSDGVSEIQLVMNKTYDSKLGDEGYNLQVKSTGIIVNGNTPGGIFYGVQSLIQLLPIEIDNREISIPCVNIEDYPRFAWRGLLFDAAHWWYEMEDLKKFIDEMAKYKYNKLTLHLTNDQAWRIEIKAFPKLNEIGSWRVPRTGRYHSFEPPQIGEKATYGGYYTQEELKELVKYAQIRNVTIIPKIELPGHMGALIASYPSASCTGLKYDVNPGSPRKYGEIPYEMCAGNESNFEMLDKILDEYVEMFPSEYIHIGGDEVNKSFWKTCSKCHKRMAEENLENTDELQSYFIHRVEKMLTDKGRKLVGWDEILEGGLAPSATVMSWRGVKGGIKAAQMKHDVVMAPNTFTYFDYKQTDPNIIPETYSRSLLRLSQTYNWEPVPESVDPQYIIGGQGQLWTEYMPHIREIEYMTWPRGLALSEVLWSPKIERNTDEFLERVEEHFPRFEKAQVKYAKSIYDPIVTRLKTEEGSVQLQFSTEVKDLDIYYTFDGTIPDNFSPKYEGQAIDIPKGATLLGAVTFRNGDRVGKWLSISIKELQSRLPVDYTISPPKY